MLAQRHELKYFVDVEQAAHLRRDLQGYVDKDPNCADKDSYLVNSLYFDTTDYEFFAQKIEGQKYRHKIRLRCYGENGSNESRVFLEMKKKINNCIYKSRSAAPLNKIRSILNGRDNAFAKLFNGEMIFTGVDNILYLARQLRVTPSVGVVYRRRAFVGQDDRRLRITFDEQVAAQNPEVGLELDSHARPLFDPHLVILEIKVNNWMPLWLAHIVEKHNLTLRSISKYCHAVMVQNVNLRDTRY